MKIDKLTERAIRGLMCATWIFGLFVCASFAALSFFHSITQADLVFFIISELCTLAAIRIHEVLLKAHQENEETND